MSRGVLPVLALDKEDGDAWIKTFKADWKHLIKALQAVYELQYVTSRREAKQLMGSGALRAVLAIDSAAASAVKSSGFLQVRQGMLCDGCCDVKCSTYNTPCWKTIAACRGL